MLAAGNQGLYDLLVQLAGESLVAMLVLSAPAVIVALGVGFIISLFQAVTQIQEQTLTFVPKIIAVFLILLITGSWMIDSIKTFTEDTYDTVAEYVRQ